MKLKQVTKIIATIFIFIFTISVCTMNLYSSDSSVSNATYETFNTNNGQFKSTYQNVFKYSNVFCVERGNPFGDGEQTFEFDTISDADNNVTVKNIEIQDPLLIFILNLDDSEYNIPAGEYRKNNHRNGIKQNLIWWYLKKYSDSVDTKKIVNDHQYTGDGNFLNITETKINYRGTEITIPNMVDGRFNFKEAYEAYLESMFYISDYGYNDTKVYFQIDNFNKNDFEIYTNDSNTPNTSYTYSNGKIEISTENFEGTQFKVKVKKNNCTEKTATVNIIKNTAGYQRLILSDVGTKSCETTIYIPLEYTGVSLQKYIVEVKDSLDNILYDDEETRKDTKVTRSDTSKISRYISAREFYKIENPMLINLNDTVIYRIEVYNNSNEDLTNVIVTDTVSVILFDTVLKPTGKFESISGSNDVIIKYKDFSGAEKEQPTDDTSTAEIIIPLLEAGASKSFDVTIKYDKILKNADIDVYGNVVPISYANRAEVSSTDDNLYRTVDFDYIRMKNADISLQKNITKVTKANGTEIDYSGSRSRAWQKTEESETNTSIVGESGNFRDISKIQNNVSNISDKFSRYKYNAPVEIDKGDIVEYNITVYNNSNYTDAKNVKIRDTIPEGSIIKSVTSLGTDFTDSVVEEEDGTYSMSISTIEADELYRIKVELQFTEYSSSILTNTAWISSVEGGNDTIYRTRDKDYVIMSEPKINVSLQKYIIKVNNTDISGRANKKTSRDASNSGIVGNGGIFKPIYKKEDGNDQMPDANYYKKANPVNIKNGDEVTYRIYIYNNSDNPYIVPEKIRIKDTIPEGSNIVSVKLGGSTEIYNCSNSQFRLDTGRTYYCDLTGFQEGQNYQYIDVTLEFNINTGNILENLAWIDSANTVPDNEDTYRTVDADYVQLKPNVSLQKYIVKVNGTNLGVNDTSLTDRKHTRTYAGDSAVANNIYYNKTSGLIQSSENYKKSNPVYIEVGDTVTYRIWVYNNTSRKVNSVIIRDNLPYYRDGSNNAISYVDTKSIVIRDNNNNLVDYEQYTENPDNNPNTYQWEITDFSGNAIVYFDITVRFTSYTTDILTNTAWMRTTPSYETDYRTVDKDYVQMKEYKVSLEKYVTKVTDKNGSNGVEYTDRVGKPTYDIGSNDTSWKEDNMVSVEPGDIVTFRIRLKNEGDTKVKITKIYDVAELSSSGLGLKLADNNGNTENLPDTINLYIYDKNGNKTSKTATLNTNGNFTYNNTLNPAWNEYKRYEINFNGTNAILLDKNEYIDVEIKFKVIVPKEETSSVQELYNKAVILELQNKNSCLVQDSDEANNNADYDYVKTKIYAVSLEKYISQVISDDGTIIDYTEDRAGHPMYNQNDFNKSTELVSLEVGDTVEFTIRLTNTGTTPVKIDKIIDTFTVRENGKIKLFFDTAYGVRGNGGGTFAPVNGSGEITFNKPVVLMNQNEYTDVTIRFEVQVNYDYTNTVQAFVNEARILDISNRNNVPVSDSDESGNNYDADCLETKTYVVSLVKYVSKLQDSQGNTIVADNSREIYEEHKGDNDINTVDKTKYNSPVTVSNGDKVTYTIKVTNNGNTAVTITNIADYLPNGIKYNGTEYTGSIYCTEFDNGQTNNRTAYTNPISLNPGASHSFNVTVDVIEPNISVNVLKNVAEITDLQNRNACPVMDTTLNDNKDADYIQLEYEEYEETTEYRVVKKWTGDSSSRPAQITVKLFEKQGEYEIDLGMNSVVLSEANNWEYTWTNLPIGVTYIARELNEDGNIVKGTTKYNENIQTRYIVKTGEIEIINNCNEPPEDYPEPEKTNYTVEKVWEDNNNSSRPKSITVRLFKVVNGKKEQVENDITLNNSNWTYTWTNLEKYDADGRLINYTAREINDRNVIEEGSSYDNDYTAFYLHSANKTTITNKMEVEEDLNDIVISGMVWNDLALNKTQDEYNGLKDVQEVNLSGVKVMLYRVGKGVVATTYTDQNGEYNFTNNSLISTLLTNEKFIKGPKVPGTNRWDGSYYSYYVIFEYDGITYTSTKFADYTSTNSLDSNAREKLNNEQYDGQVDKTRNSFNSGFSTINKNSGISYSTVNENGYVPQSIHQYNENMAIQSSTKRINLQNSEELQEQLQHINLGLRGRDVFDLEITSDVYSTKVTVNRVDGEYNYNNNIVTLRREDISNYNYKEDTANSQLDDSKYLEDGKYEQKVRTLDITNSKKATGLSIFVTYKITVTNTSKTVGTATKITNYYDSKYNFIGAYYSAEDAEKLQNKRVIDNNTTKAPEDGDKYGYVTIYTPAIELNQSEEMAIYVVYELKEAVGTLEGIDDMLPTYNMVEITEYETYPITYADGTNNEATRGLIDKDSAPGSVNSEKVRLHPNLIGNTSTLEYYFGGNDLSILKYEDDTYATPTLYFVKDNSQRIIEGVVFEDLTKLVPTTRIKTGDGVKTDNENGVYGATVQLIEVVGENETVVETVTTEKNGTFRFTGFLPGNYIIKYSYGDTENTVVLNKAEPGINSKSYNGEDFQSTNNFYEVKDENGNIITNSLSTMPNFWYAYNKSSGISTATDNGTRRITVSNNVTDFTDLQIADLNNLRIGSEVTAEGINNIIDKTNMFAKTELMLFTVEETYFDGNNLIQRDEFGEYNISNMNFGIAEVPVTTVDLEKYVSGFTIKDAAGQNVIASMSMNEIGVWELQGDVLPNLNGRTDVSIEDEKLQGARLEITYTIGVDVNAEVNFDGAEAVVPTIKTLVDLVSNNLSYNEKLGNNSKYWEISTDNIDGINNNIVLKAKADNPLLLTSSGKATATVTLEKVLSSTDSTLDEIITSTVDTYEYFNTVRIMEFDYTNTTSDIDGDGQPDVMKDRIRNSDRYIILPGLQYDYVISDTLVIHPPTGDSSISITYYILAVISLVILAVGAFGIKKFVIKK